MSRPRWSEAWAPIKPAEPRKPDPMPEHVREDLQRVRNELHARVMAALGAFVVEELNRKEPRR